MIIFRVSKFKFEFPPKPKMAYFSVLRSGMCQILSFLNFKLKFHHRIGFSGTANTNPASDLTTVLLISMIRGTICPLLTF